MSPNIFTFLADGIGWLGLNDEIGAAGRDPGARFLLSSGNANQRQTVEVCLDPSYHGKILGVILLIWG